MANISEINGYGIYAQTASLANTASLAVSSSYATTASFALNGGGTSGGTNLGLVYAVSLGYIMP
jgi:hypothetical protein